MADPEVMSELVHDESAVLPAILDARGDHPDAAALRQRHVVRPIGVPRLELLGALELLDDEGAPAWGEAYAPAGAELPYLHGLSDEDAFVVAEPGIEGVRNRLGALARTRARVTYGLARARPNGS